MVGDLADFVSRIRSVLPKRWFGEQSPNLQSVLTGMATPWVWLYGVIGYVVDQTRLSTATEEWLDLIANDYFGDFLKRKANEADASYRSRIKLALLQEAATRTGISAGVKALTGVAPVIFEPGNCMDSGGYGSLSLGSNAVGSGMAYGLVGGWGNLQMPLQFFITVTRPPTTGLDSIAGYGTSSGAYGRGESSYVDLALLPGQITDADIQATICRLLPVNATAWLRII